MPRLLNQEEAQCFREAIADPVIRGLCTKAFTQILLSEHDYSGDFDVLFYTKMIFELVKDKNVLLKELAGEGSEDVFVD